MSDQTTAQIRTRIDEYLAGDRDVSNVPCESARLAIYPDANERPDLGTFTAVWQQARNPEPAPAPEPTPENPATLNP